MAERGYDITGVDITPEMLEAAKQKASDRGLSVNWVHADARHLELGRKYRMIFTTGNAFQAFLDRESQEGLLRTVHRHLDEDGVFAFETRNPVLSLLSDDKRTVQELSPFLDKDGKRVTVTRQRSYDHKSQLEHYVVTYRRWKNEFDVDETLVNRIAIRYVFPQELEALAVL